MECVWPLNRYSRYYADYHKQAHDASGKISLFPYFTQSSHGKQLMDSHLVNTGTWSTITRRNKIKIYLVLRISSESQCSFLMRMETVHEDWEVEAATQMAKTQQPIMHNNTIILEQLEFPASFDVDFKASPKTECISFRYMLKNEKFCFQADFDSAFECYMCFHMMMRAGILHSQWSQLYNFELMDRLDFPQSTAGQSTTITNTLASAMAPVQESYSIAYPPTPQATLSVHENFLLLQVPKSDDNEEDSDSETQLPEDNFSLLFAPSQPLASSKFSELGFPSIAPQVPCLHSSTGPSFDIEDENVFMPLSFQEFGY